MILETHSGPLFREHARAWLTLHPRLRDRSPRVIPVPGKKRPVVVAEFVNCPAGYRFREVLLVRGDFQCGPGCTFEAPVFVGGNAVVGKNSVMESLCTDGTAVLGLGARVREWVDSCGALDLRAGAWVEGAAVSETSIQLSLEAGAGHLFAPQILTQGHFGGLCEPPPSRDLLEVPRPCDRETPEFGAVRGFRFDKLTPLGAETWAYDGSLALPAPVWLRAKLVVRGSFSCTAGSLLEDDVKSGATIRIGAGSVCRGNLTARGELTLEQDCLFEGALQSGLALRLCCGVRGFHRSDPVEAVSREKLILEPNVCVRGRLGGELGVAAGQQLIEGGLELLLAEG